MNTYQVWRFGVMILEVIASSSEEVMRHLASIHKSWDRIERV
jgi:hypothetical protein